MLFSPSRCGLRGVKEVGCRRRLGFVGEASLQIPIVTQIRPESPMLLSMDLPCFTPFRSFESTRLIEPPAALQDNSFIRLFSTATHVPSGHTPVREADGQ